MNKEIILVVISFAILASCKSTTLGGLSNTTIKNIEKGEVDESVGVTGQYKGVCKSTSGDINYEAVASIRDGKKIQAIIEVFPSDNNPSGECGSYLLVGTKEKQLFTPDIKLRTKADKQFYYSTINAGEKLSVNPAFHTGPNGRITNFNGRFRKGGVVGFFGNHGVEGCFELELTRVSPEVDVFSGHTMELNCKNRPIPKCNPIPIPSDIKGMISAQCKSKASSLAGSKTQAQIENFYQKCKLVSSCQYTQRENKKNRECGQYADQLMALEEKGIIAAAESFIYLNNPKFLKCDAAGVKGYDGL